MALFFSICWNDGCGRNDNNEVRDVITIRLKEEFVNPQVDVTVVGFNEKEMYML